MDRSLFDQNAVLCTEADEILWHKGLHALLSQYGEVQVTGSYALELMAWRDLDLYLVAKDLPVSTFFELGSRIAEKLGAPRMHFRNERVACTPGLPCDGLYWGVYMGDERAEAWKIDLWCISPLEAKELKRYVDEIAARLTPDTRHVILEIKSQSWMLPGYRSRFSSQDIYRAVLDRGIGDIEGFDAYVREIKGYGIRDE